MNYKQFVEYAFKVLKADYVQPETCSNIRVSAVAVNQRTAQALALWIPRKGIVWERKK